MTTSRITDPVLFASVLRYVSDTNYRHRGNPGDLEISRRFPSWNAHEIAATMTQLIDLGYVIRITKPSARKPIYAVTETGLSRLRGVTA